jgi:hypothetical protein
VARSCFACVCVRACLFVFFVLKCFFNSSLLLRVHVIRSLALSRLSIIIIIFLILFFVCHTFVSRGGGSVFMFEKQGFVLVKR